MEYSLTRFKMYLVWGGSTLASLPVPADRVDVLAPRTAASNGRRRRRRRLAARAASSARPPGGLLPILGFDSKVGFEGEVRELPLHYYYTKHGGAPPAGSLSPHHRARYRYQATCRTSQVCLAGEGFGSVGQGLVCCSSLVSD